MNANQASEKLTRAIKFNNGKIATTQLEQIMLACIDPKARPFWSKMIKLGLQAPSYADTIFSLRKIDNTYHQIVELRDMNTLKTIWTLN